MAFWYMYKLAYRNFKRKVGRRFSNSPKCNHFNPLQFCPSMSLLGFPEFFYSFEPFFDILGNSMTIWSVLKLPKIAWPGPFNSIETKSYYGLKLRIVARSSKLSDNTANTEDLTRQMLQTRSSPCISFLWLFLSTSESDTRYLSLTPSRWEISPKQIDLHTILGNGAFGEVWKAVAYGLRGLPAETTVAVKRLKRKQSLVITILFIAGKFHEILFILCFENNTHSLPPMHFVFLFFDVFLLFFVEVKPQKGKNCASLAVKWLEKTN